MGFGSCGWRAQYLQFWALEHKLNSCGTWGLSWSEACGIFLDQGSSPHLLHWQGDALPLSHQGSPLIAYIRLNCFGLETPRVVSVSALSPDCYRRLHRRSFHHVLLSASGRLCRRALYPPDLGRFSGASSVGPVRERQGPVIRAVMMTWESEKASATASPTQGI